MNSPRDSEYYAPEIETMPREKLELLQLKRLKWQVQRCYHNSEFYRERFNKIGLKPDDMIIYKGENFYPIQVEKVVRSFKEVSDEYKIRLTTDQRTGIDVVTVVTEHVAETVNTDELKNRLKKALREELAVTPEVELVKLGTLERAEFKAKRIEDLRHTP